MHLRSHFLRVLFSVLLLAAQLASAHSPFDSSAHVVLHSNSVEVVLTVGDELAGQLLDTVSVQQTALNRTGHPTAVPSGLGNALFAVTADQSPLIGTSASVVTDGLEFQLHVNYPFAHPTNIALVAQYLGRLKPPQNSVILVTDDDNNILATAILRRGNEGVTFDLPKPAPVAETNAPVATVTAPVPAVDPVVSAPVRPSFFELFKLGVEHILTGYDHLLFLFALLLGCRKLKPMLVVITGFTVAHSITLALSALSVVSLSPDLVEPIIAASIAVVAVENFRKGEVRWERYALTCLFGLIHGFGFASALRETGLARGGAELARDLLAFNLGVETGQLAVAAVVVPVLFLLRGWGWFARSGAKWLSSGVILVACYWFLQRVFPHWF